MLTSIIHVRASQGRFQWTCLWGLVVALSHGSAGLGQQNSALTMVPVHADLIKSLDSSKLVEGSRFFLQTTSDWAVNGCKLRSQTSIEGEVAGVHRKKEGAARNELLLRFASVPCVGSEAEAVTPVLIAMRGPQVEHFSAMEEMEQHIAEEQAVHDLFNPPPPSNLTLPGTNLQLNTGNPGSSLRGIENVRSFGRARDSVDPDAGLKTGDVAGIHGVRMDLPSGEPVTTLYSQHDFFLGTHTTFLLAFVRHANDGEGLRAASAASKELNNLDSKHVGKKQTAVADAGSAYPAVPNAATPAAAPKPSPVEEPDVCVATGCAQLATAGPDATGKASWLAALNGLGYASRPGETIRALDEQAAVHFVGEDAVLVTFDPHGLVKRSSEELRAGRHPHNVRAVLLAADTGRVLRVRDWTAPGDGGPCVWGLRDGRVLALENDQLLVYDAKLDAQPHRYALPGPLVFVSVTPGTGPILMATVHEKHTAEEHARLVAFLGAGIPIAEDYDLIALDRDLNETGRTLLTTEPTAPALLPTAMVTAHPERNAHWLVEEQSWSGVKKTLSRFSSDCPVDLNALPGPLILAEGCTPGKSQERWYRVMNGQGATLIKTTPPMADFIQQVETDADGQMLAIATTHFDRPVDLPGGMTAGQFARLSVVAYNTANGKELFAVDLPEGSPLSRTMAIAPSGRRIAVLTTGGLRLFAVEQRSGTL